MKKPLVIVAMTCALLWVFTVPASATVIQVDLEQHGGYFIGQPGQIVDLNTASIKEYEGNTCVAKVTAENQFSMHPNTDLIISTGGKEYTVADVEREAFFSTANDVVLSNVGSDISFSIRLGSDGASSLEITIELDCEVTPATSTTTTVVTSNTTENTSAAVSSTVGDTSTTSVVEGTTSSTSGSSTTSSTVCLDSTSGTSSGAVGESTTTTSSAVTQAPTTNVSSCSLSNSGESTTTTSGTSTPTSEGTESTNGSTDDDLKSESAGISGSDLTLGGGSVEQPAKAVTGTPKYTG